MEKLKKIIIEARRIVKMQDDALENNGDTMEEDFIQFVRGLSEMEIK